MKNKVTQQTEIEEHDMVYKPIFIDLSIQGSNKLQNKVAVITGGDSGIGRAVAASFAREGSDIAILYLESDIDAKETQEIVHSFNRKCLLIKADVGNKDECEKAVKKIISELGKIDILINNAAQQQPQDIENITEDQLIKTFRANIFSQFFMVQACLPYLKENSKIINTSSVTAYRGSPKLIDYSSTKGAIISFTRSLSTALMEKKIYVNAVAPGPIWTPLIPSTFDQKKVNEFGKKSPMKRAGHPYEVAPSFLFLASNDSSFMSGQVLHPNGGEIING